MKKKIPFIIIGAVLLQGLLIFGCVKFLQLYGPQSVKENVQTLGNMSYTVPNGYVETTVQDRDVTYVNGSFVITCNLFTKSYFMEVATTMEDKEHFAKFIMDMNPSYSFSEISEEDDYVYFSFEGISNNKSYSKMAAVFEDNGDFYFIQVECPTSNEYMLEDTFEDFVDTVSFN